MKDLKVKLGSIMRNSLIVILGLSTTYSFSQTVTATGGDWFSAGSWDTGVPTCGATIVIPAGITITLEDDVLLDEPNGCSTATMIDVYGTLAYTNNGGTIYLACGSGVSVYPGGTFGTDGSGNAERLFICGVVVYNADNDPPPTGPAGFGSSPLPIELLSFSAKNDDTQVLISWATASEINNDYFTIERSKDGLTYHVLATLSGAGTSASILNYSFIDKSPLFGRSYYRLKQTDFDGASETFNPRTINFSTLIEGNLRFQPNPVNSGDKIMIATGSNSDETLSLTICNVNGQIVLTDLISGPTFELNLKNTMLPGIYFVKVASLKTQQVSRLLVK